MITTGRLVVRLLTVLVLAGLGSLAGATAASAQADKTTQNPAAAAAAFGAMRNLSGLCAQPATPDIGSQLVLAVCAPGNPAQGWTTVLLGSGRYQLVNQATGGCMDAHGAYVSGTPIDTWPCSNISNLRWVDGPASPTFPGYSQVRPANAQSLCVHPNGAYGQIGAPLVLRPCSNLEFRQYWSIG